MFQKRGNFITSLAFLAAGLLFNCHLVAQESGRPAKAVNRASLSGHIRDAQTGDALGGASVYFPDLKRGAIAGQDGIFKIQNLSEGKLLVEVSYTGYGSVIEQVTISEETVKDFVLRASVVEGEAVTVTGVSAATQTKRLPVPVSILKREDLLKSPSTNIIDALGKIAGVSQITTGAAISKPVIRGLGYNRVVVINDGVRQEGQQWGDEHGIEIDEYSVAKAEVLKGPASIMYGSDALAGVVNFITNVPVPEGTIKGNILANYQTNNQLRGFNANIAGNRHGINWNLYGTVKDAGDYQNRYDGYVFNSKFHELNFGGYLGINKGWGYSHLLVSNFNQHLGLIEGERDSATGKFLKLVNQGGIEGKEIASGSDFTGTDPFVPKQHIEHFKITSDNSFNVGQGRMTATVGWQRNQRQEFGNVLDPEEKSLYFDLHTFSYNFQYHFHEKKNWKTTVGLNGMQQENQNKGVEFLIPEYNLFDVGAFVYAQKRLEKMTVSGGLRVDNRHLNSKELMLGSDLKFQGFEKDFTNVSGSAGLSYEVSKLLTLKLNLARGFRSPSIPELASNGAHEGTNRYEYGEQDLKSETSIQVDGGVELNSEHVSLNASLFYNGIHNFIYYRKLSAVAGGDSVIMNGPDSTFAFRFAQNDAKLYGAEINFDIHPHPLDWLHFENTFSYVRGLLSETQDGSKNLPFIPAAKLIDDLRGNFLKKGKGLRNLYVSIELENTFAQNNPFTGFNTETPTPGYSLLNAGAGTDIQNKKGKTLLSVHLAVNNITDVAYQNHLSRLKYTPVNLVTGRSGVFNMGRNASIKVNIPLNFDWKE